MKIGRNNPCPCGSGKKYKKCCMNKMQQNNSINHNSDIPKQAKTIQSVSHSLNEPHIRPYVIAKMAEGNSAFGDLKPHFKSLHASQHFPSNVRLLTNEMIIKKLSERNVSFDEALFIEECYKHDSAWDVSEELWLKHVKVKTKDVADFCGLAACILWERLYQDNKLNKLSVEMIDDLIEKGYDKNEYESSEIWLKAWNGLKSLFDISNLSIDQLDNIFSGCQSIYDWCYDFEINLINAAINNKKYAKIGISFLDEFISFFSNNEELIKPLQRSLAELYSRADNHEKGEQIMTEFIKRYPEDASGYIGMDTVIAIKPSVDKQLKLKERLQILEQARNYPVINGDDYDLNMRIDDLKKELQTLKA